jgi:hypothetical protein
MTLSAILTASTDVQSVREASPPRGIEGEHVGALRRREPLDQLDHGGHAVDRGAREGEPVVAAEPEAIDRVDAREVRDRARVADQQLPRSGRQRGEASRDLDVLAGDVRGGLGEVLDLPREPAQGPERRR